MAEEQLENSQVEDGEQNPSDKPTSKKKKEGGMSILTMSLIGLGVVVVNVVLIVVIINFVMPQFSGEHHDDKNKKGGHKTDKSSDSHHEKNADESKLEEEEADFLENEKERHYFETGKITTNPKMSSKFVILGLGMEFKPKPEVFENPEEAFKADGPMMKKMLSRIKAAVIKEIGTMSPEELQMARPNLDKQFRDKLKPIFAENKLFLRTVDVTEFIVQ